MTSEEIQKDIEEKIKKALHQAAEQIAEDTQDLYDSTIDWFYDEYSPKYYNRSYDLYKTCKKVIGQTGDGIYAGIRLNPQKIHPTHDSPEYVFKGAFEMGIHGTSSIFVGEPGSDEMDRLYEHYKKRILPNVVKEHIENMK